jgi:hypothetical protein
MSRRLTNTDENIRKAGFSRRRSLDRKGLAALKRCAD